jgi:hypothetical protein
MKSGMRKSTRVSAITVAFAVSAICGGAGTGRRTADGHRRSAVSWIWLGLLRQWSCLLWGVWSCGLRQLCSRLRISRLHQQPGDGDRCGSVQLSLPPPASCWARARLLSERVSKRVPHQPILVSWIRKQDYVEPAIARSPFMAMEPPPIAGSSCFAMNNAKAATGLRIGGGFLRGY